MLYITLTFARAVLTGNVASSCSHG